MEVDEVGVDADVDVADDIDVASDDAPVTAFILAAARLCGKGYPYPISSDRNQKVPRLTTGFEL